MVTEVVLAAMHAICCGPQRTATDGVAEPVSPRVWGRMLASKDALVAGLRVAVAPLRPG